MIRERREELGISQAELARRIGIAQPSLHNIEIGKTKHSRHLMDIYDVLGMDMRTGRKGPAGRIGASDSAQPTTCPVYLMRPSADGAEMTLTEHPIDYVAKPALLATVPDAFGICVWGEDNYPAYRAGDIIFIHPYMPPVISADVIARPIDESDLRVYLGELTAESATDFSVRTYKGQSREFSKTEWRLDRIVGKYNRR